MNHSAKFRYPEPDPEVEETDSDSRPSDIESSRTATPLLSSKLKARFAKIHDERGSLSERRSWLKNNLNTKCSSCEERGVKCSPHPENIRCEPCNRRKNGCSRVSDERRDRAMRTLRIDRKTYEMLSSWYDKNKTWYKGERVGQSNTSRVDTDMPIRPSVKKPIFSDNPTQRSQLKTPIQPVFRGAYKHPTPSSSKAPSNAGVKNPIASMSRSTVQTSSRSTVPVHETPHTSKAKTVTPVPSSSKTVRFAEDARSERAREKAKSKSEYWESEGSQEDEYDARLKVKSKSSVLPRDLCQTSNRGDKPGQCPDRVRNSSYVEISEDEEREHQHPRHREPTIRVKRGSSLNDEESEDTDEDGRVSGQKKKQKVMVKSKATSSPAIPAKPSAEGILELVMLQRKVELSMGDVDRGTGLWSNLDEIRQRLGNIATSQIDEMITHSESGTSVTGASVRVGEARRRRREDEEQEAESSMKRIKTMSSRDPNQTVDVKQRQKH